MRRGCRGRRGPVIRWKREKNYLRKRPASRAISRDGKGRAPSLNGVYGEECGWRTDDHHRRRQLIRESSCSPTENGGRFQP